MNLIIFLLLSFTCILAQNDILLLQEVFRHGARYALFPAYQQGLPETQYGQLTSVGKRMHYLLGKQLYSEYWKRLNMPDYYNASLIRVNSTDFNRTIESCQSQLFGWLQEVKKPQYQGKPIFGDLNFQPVPINVYQKNVMYADGQGQPMLYYDYPNGIKWREENYQSEFYVSKIKPIVDKQLEYLQNNFGLKFNRTQVRDFIDVYHSNKSIGFDIHPVFKMPERKNMLEFIYIVCQYLDIFYSQKQISVTTTIFFSELKQNLLASIRGSTIKLRLYSAHDVTLMNILVGLNLTNAELAYQKYIIENTTVKGAYSFPPYASNLLVQLSKSEQNIQFHKSNYDVSANYVVKIRYNGIYLPLQFCKNSVNCSIQDFLSYIDKRTNPNYRILAGFYEQPKSNIPVTTIVLSCLLLLYLTYKVIMYMRVKRKSEGIFPINHFRSNPSASNQKKNDNDPVEMKQNRYSIIGYGGYIQEP